MPKARTVRDHSAQLTYDYYKWDGSDKQLKTSGAKNLELLYYGLLNYMDEHEGQCSEKLNDLYKNVKEFRDGLKSSAEYFRNNRNLDRNLIEQQQKKLGDLYLKINNGFKALPEKEKQVFDKYQKNLSNMECEDAQRVHHASGELKSAAKWIEQFKKGLKRPEDYTSEVVAKIFAARQLSDAKLGKRANIDNNKLTETEINNQAAKLMGSPVFKKYANEVLSGIDYSIMKHGHGGKLEKTFEDFVVQMRPKKQLEIDLKGRYQVKVDAAIEKDKPKVVSTPSDYTNYSDFIKKNKGKVQGSRIAQAAKMAAANELARKKPEDPFDSKALNKKAQEFLKDPAFKVLASSKENVDKLIKGDFVGIAKEAEDVKTSCLAMVDVDGKLDSKGYTYLALDRLENRAAENPDLKPVVDSVSDLCDPDKKHTAEDVLNTVGTIVSYQNKHAADSIGPKAKDLADTMRLLHELTKGRYINGIVDDQMKMINETRSYKPDHPAYMNRERIEAEGIAEEKQIAKDLGIEEPKKAEPKAEPKAENDPLNTGVNYGHGPVA